MSTKLPTVLALLLLGCAFETQEPTVEPPPAAQEDFSEGPPQVTVQLESATQDLSLTALDLSRLLLILSQTWHDLYGDDRGTLDVIHECLNKLVLYIPSDDDSFQRHCHSDSLSVGCESYASIVGLQYEGSYVIMIRWDFYRVIGSRDPILVNDYTWVIAHEVTHRLLQCAGDADGGHTSPVWDEFVPLATQVINDTF